MRYSVRLFLHCRGLVEGPAKQKDKGFRQPSWSRTPGWMGVSWDCSSHALALSPNQVSRKNERTPDIPSSGFARASAVSLCNSVPVPVPALFAGMSSNRLQDEWGLHSSLRSRVSGFAEAASATQGITGALRRVRICGDGNCLFTAAAVGHRAAKSGSVETDLQKQRDWGELNQRVQLEWMRSIKDSGTASGVGAFTPGAPCKSCLAPDCLQACSFTPNLKAEAALPSQENLPPGGKQHNFALRGHRCIFCKATRRIFCTHGVTCGRKCLGWMAGGGGDGLPMEVPHHSVSLDGATGDCRHLSTVGVAQNNGSIIRLLWLGRHYDLLMPASCGVLPKSRSHPNIMFSLCSAAFGGL